jgi:transcriptional regulator with XRE-family HTH domain
MSKSVSFTDQIRQAVLDSDMSRNQIATETGIDKGSLSRFVNGERGLSVAAIDKVADLLGLEVTEKKGK